MFAVCPPKQDPDNVSFNNELHELNQFRAELVEFQKDDDMKQSATDAIKVVDCIRFIKVNLDDKGFICFAFINRRNKDHFNNIYKHNTDISNGVFRDLQGTSFHFNAYKDVVTLVNSLRRMVDTFQGAVAVARSSGELKSFVGKIRYDAAVGCLEARIQSCLLYASELKQNVTRLEDEMSKIYSKLNGDDQHDISIAVRHLQPLFGHRIFINGTEKILTKKAVIDYMVNTFGYNYNYDSDSVKKDAGAAEKSPDKMMEDAEEKALKLIRRCQAAVKMMRLSNDDKNISYVVDQLCNPKKKRPIKTLDPGSERNSFWNPRTGSWHLRDIQGLRGRNKDTPYTKKMAVSLLPPHGKIKLFFEKGTSIGFVFDLSKCHLKNEKYVWYRNANSNSKWWIKGAVSAPRLIPSVPLEQLQKQLSEFAASNRVPEHNELLIGLTSQALEAILIDGDSLVLRLYAIKIRYYCKQALGVDLPILRISTTDKPMPYSVIEQYKDYFLAKTYARYWPARKSADTILQEYPQFETDYIFYNKEKLWGYIHAKNFVAVGEYLQNDAGNFTYEQAILLMEELHDKPNLIKLICNKTEPTAKVAIEMIARFTRALKQESNKNIHEVLVNHCRVHGTLAPELALYLFTRLLNAYENNEIFDSIRLIALHTEQGKVMVLLERAIYLGRGDVVSLLVDNGAWKKINSTHSSARHILFLALQAGMLDPARLMLQKFLNQEAFLQKLLFDIVDNADIQIDSQRDSAVNLILSIKKNFNVNAYSDIYGNSVLHQAVTHGYNKIVAMLCDVHADSSASNRFGESVLSLALKSENLSPENLVKMLGSQNKHKYSVAEVLHVIKMLVSNENIVLAKQFLRLSKLSVEDQQQLHFIVLMDDKSNQELVSILLNQPEFLSRGDWFSSVHSSPILELSCLPEVVWFLLREGKSNVVEQLQQKFNSKQEHRNHLSCILQIKEIYNFRDNPEEHSAIIAELRGVKSLPSSAKWSPSAMMREDLLIAVDRVAVEKKQNAVDMVAILSSDIDHCLAVKLCCQLLSQGKVWVATILYSHILKEIPRKENQSYSDDVNDNYQIALQAAIEFIDKLNNKQYSNEGVVADTFSDLPILKTLLQGEKLNLSVVGFILTLKLFEKMLVSNKIGDALPDDKYYQWIAEVPLQKYNLCTAIHGGQLIYHSKNVAKSLLFPLTSLIWIGINPILTEGMERMESYSEEEREQILVWLNFLFIIVPTLMTVTVLYPKSGIGVAKAVFFDELREHFDRRHSHQSDRQSGYQRLLGDHDPEEGEEERDDEEMAAPNPHSPRP